MPFVATLAIVTILAALAVYALHRLRQSPVCAYLLLGVALGPHTLRLLWERNRIEHLADIGILLLMFFIGLEFHLGEMRSFARIAGIGGGLQILLTAGAVIAILTPFGMPPLEAGLFGLLVAFSSTALVLKAYEDRNESDTYRARTALGILLAQDVASIAAVALLPLVAGRSAASSGAIASPGLRIALLALLPAVVVVSRRLLPRLFARVAAVRSQELFALVALASCAAMAWIADLAGASVALGAFLGGIALSGTPVAHQIRADLSPIRNIAIGLFFVCVGALLDVRFLYAHLPLIILGLALVIVLKGAIVVAVLALIRIPISVAGAVGLALGQIGEFSFVLAGPAVHFGLLREDSYQAMLAIAILSLLVTPFLIGRSGYFGRRLDAHLTSLARLLRMAPAAGDGPRSKSRTSLQRMGLGLVPVPDRAVIVGYGVVGQAIASELRRIGVETSVIDLNLATVRELNASAIRAVYGDAARWEVLQAAGIDRARWLVVTIPGLSARTSIIAAVRSRFPNIPIYTRGRYILERADLARSGATHISFEEAEVAVGLTRLLLADCGLPDEAIRDAARRIRTVNQVDTETVIRSLADVRAGLPASPEEPRESR